MSATDHRGRRRVAVTGMGVKAPGGVDVTSFWETLRTARSQAAPIDRWDAAGDPVRFACHVDSFDPEAYFTKKQARRMDRVTQLGLAAAADAVEQAGAIGADPARAGVVVGTGIGGLWTLEEQVRANIERGPRSVSPLFVPMMMPNATAGTIGLRYGWQGPNLCISTACAAGANAIGEAARLIRDQSVDVAMAGGTEAIITPTCMAAFARMTALSTRNDDPQTASRPFDRDRDGFVMGEGAAMLVLEDLARAEARGATILGEVTGYGRTSDAHHITAPSPGGEGAAACMEQAITDAGLSPSDVGHVNAHGTSTPLNDAAEAEAIRKVFGDAPPPVTSTKGVTGHLIGAAGAVEAVASLLSIQERTIPPTANLTNLDDAIEIDVVAHSPRPLEAGAVVSNSFGFGGHNATLVFAGG